VNIPLRIRFKRNVKSNEQKTIYHEIAINFKEEKKRPDSRQVCVKNNKIFRKMYS